MDTGQLAVFATVIPVLLLASSLRRDVIQAATQTRLMRIALFGLAMLGVSGEAIALVGVAAGGLPPVPAGIVIGTAMGTLTGLLAQTHTDLFGQVWADETRELIEEIDRRLAELGTRDDLYRANGLADPVQASSIDNDAEVLARLIDDLHLRTAGRSRIPRKHHQERRTRGEPDSGGDDGDEPVHSSTPSR